MCPSDPSRLANTAQGATTNGRADIWTSSNYAANYFVYGGPTKTNTTERREGGRSQIARTFLDGTSNTVVYAEALWHLRQQRQSERRQHLRQPLVRLQQRLASRILHRQFEQGADGWRLSPLPDVPGHAGLDSRVRLRSTAVATLRRHQSRHGRRQCEVRPRWIERQSLDRGVRSARWRCGGQPDSMMFACATQLMLCSYRTVLAVYFGVLLLAGCGSSSTKEEHAQTWPVKGKVLNSGQPLTAGTIEFQPTGAGARANGEIGPDAPSRCSRFSIRTRPMAPSRELIA